MKKILSALLSSVIVMSSATVLPFEADAANGTQYEFEKGRIENSGENGAEITSISGAVQEKQLTSMTAGILLL